MLPDCLGGEIEQNASGGLDSPDGQISEMAASHKDDVFEGAQDLVALVADAIDEFKSQVCQLCIGVYECFKEY